MASRTALALVQGVMRKLRDEVVSAFPSPLSDPTAVTLDLVNEAKEEILEDRVWGFDIYDDKKLVFLAKQSGSTATTTDANTQILIPQGAFTIDQFVGETTPVRLRIQVTNGSTPNTTYPVRKAVIALTNLRLTLASEYMGGTDSGSAEWETYCYEAVYPSTVRKIVGAWQQETPLTLRGDPGLLHFDNRFPRPQDHTSSQQELYVSGRSMQNTWSDDATASGTGIADTTGFGLRVFPVPTTRTVIDYAYVKRHARLADDADTIAGVPDRVLDLIEWKACVKALYSLKDSDAAHGRMLDAKIEREVRMAHSATDPTPNVRHVPVPFGGGRHHFHRRHLDEEVPSP